MDVQSQELHYVNQFIKPLFFLFIISQLLAPALAHVNWFVGTEVINTVEPFRLAEHHVQIALILFCVALLMAWLLDRVISIFYRPSAMQWKNQHSVLRFAQILVGIALFYSAIKSAFFAPHFSGTDSIPWLALCIEALVGVLLIAGKWVRASALVMLVLYVYLGAVFGFVSFLEYLNYAGLAVVFMVFHEDADERTQQVALTVFRVSLGVALITLGLSEKLTDPGLAMSFLQQYEQINFMKMLGFNFSDRLFVLSSGLAEALFGAVFILGIVTRINTVVLAMFLIASNSYFFIIGQEDLAMMELLGHTPLFACAILLVALGKGANTCELYVYVSNIQVALSRRLNVNRAH